MIKYNVKTVNDWLYNSNPIKGMYYNGRRVYRRFVANGQPTPPVFDGKWKATYQDEHVESAQCDSSSIRPNEITLQNLVSIEIGSCVTSINTWSLTNCPSLTSIKINTGNTVFDSRDNCNAIIETSTNNIKQGCNGTIIPNSVTNIGQYAFYGATFNNITIPNSVRGIGNQAFYDCPNLTSVIFPDSVTYIGSNVIRESPVTSVEIGSGITSIGSASFAFSYSLTSITVNAIVPPTLGSDVFYETNNCPIYVPDASVNDYKTARIWSAYASRIKPISEKPE